MTAAFCPLEYHNNTPLSLICSNPACRNNRVFCSHCLRVYHRDCLSFILNINDIYKRSFSENIEWIQDPSIAKAALNIEKHHLNSSNNHLTQNAEKLISEQFSKLIEYFVERIQEVKRRVVRKIRMSSTGEGVLIEEFIAKLKRLYNFDMLLNILDPLNQGIVNTNRITRDLNNFFFDINTQQQELNDLQDLAKRINNATMSHFEIDLDIFEKFKQTLNFEAFDAYAEAEQTVSAWAWSPHQRSTTITLRNDNTIAQKVSPSDSYTAVLGDTYFVEGKWQWEIEVISGHKDARWICFGVVEPDKIYDLENLSSKIFLGMSTYGFCYGLDKIDDVGGYDNKKYVCQLDMDQGFFNILHGGRAVCQERESLRGKTFVPFVILYVLENMVKLRVLKAK